MDKILLNDVNINVNLAFRTMAGKLIQTNRNTKKKLKQIIQNIKNSNAILNNIKTGIDGLDNKQILSRMKRIDMTKEPEQINRILSNNNGNIDYRDVVMMYANINGFCSKMVAVERILQDHAVDILMLTETSTVNPIYPKIKGYSSYFVNRRLSAGGGTAILVKESLAHGVIRVDSGDDSNNNEYLLLNLNQTKPKLSLMVSYGCQAKLGSTKQISNINDIIAILQSQRARGYEVLWASDTNVHTGDLVVNGNDPKVSPAGVVLAESIKKMELRVLNAMVTDPRTYYDHKHGVTRMLDMVMVSKGVMVDNVMIDKDPRVGRPEFTPHTLDSSGGNRYDVTYSDHRPLMWQWRCGITDNFQPRIVRWKKWTKEKEAKFRALTDEMAMKVVKSIEDKPDIDTLLDNVEKIFGKAKHKCLGKFSLKLDKMLVEDDIDIWLKRAKQLDDIAKEILDNKPSLTPFKAMRSIMEHYRDQQTVSVIHYVTGDTMQEWEEAAEMIIEYNCMTMDKAPTPKDFEVIEKVKKETVRKMLDKVEERTQISWETYLKVVERVKFQKKAVFSDFIKAGPGYQQMVFHLINYLLREGIVPERFRLTMLTKLWKGKNRREILKSNRFIHCKQYLSKMMEKCLLSTIEPEIRNATPESQVGAQMRMGCRDNLLTMFITARHYEMEGLPLPMVLIDISQCFDRTRASDVIYEVVKAGCDPWIVSYLEDWTKKTDIMLSGDYTMAKGSVLDTVGQGTSLAAMGVSLLIGVGMDMAVTQEYHDQCATVGDVEVLPQAFVDDMWAAGKDGDGVRAMGNGFSVCANYCSMEVNELKSSVIVMGRKCIASKMRKDLENNPVTVQGRPIGVKSSDVYLGLTIAESGVKESVEQTLEVRYLKARDKAFQLRNMCRHPTFQDIGWMKSIVTFFQAVITPILTYSAETWYHTSEGFMETVEARYKSLLLLMLGLPKSTFYLCLLHEINVLQVKHLIAARRIKYLNKMMNGHSNDHTRRLVLQEYKMAPSDKKDETFMGNVSKLCNLYGIPDVTRHNDVTDDIITEMVRETNGKECWAASMSGKLNVPRIFLRNNETCYQAWSWTESVALLKYRVGLLKLRGQLK